MTWVYLDDGFPEHAKIIAAGPAGGWLWVCAVAFCNRRVTGGRVPAAMIPRLTALPRAMRLAEQLVEVGLFDRDGSDYRVHDYETWQSAAAKQAAERAGRSPISLEKSEARREAGRKGAQSRWQTDGKTDGNGHGKPDGKTGERDGKRDGSEDGKSDGFAGARDPAHARGEHPHSPLPTPHNPTPSRTPERGGGGPIVEPDPNREAELEAIASRLTDREHGDGIDWEAQAIRMRTESRGELRTTCTPSQAQEFGRVIRGLAAQHKRQSIELVDLLVRFATDGRGFAWMTDGKPGMAYFLRNGGERLVEAIEQAIAWEAKNGPRKPPPDAPPPAPVLRAPITSQAAGAIARAALASRRSGQSPPAGTGTPS
jgi:hypothetical protein